MEVRTTPQPGCALSAPPEEPRRSCIAWWRASAPFALLIAALSAQAQSSDPQPSPQTQTVVVTGEWEPVALEESDRSVNQYSLRDGAILFGSLADAIGLDSSVYVQSRGPGGIQDDFSIRGASFEQTLILLNGIRLNDAQSAHYNSDLAVPLDAVDHIEILRGSGSTLYGSDSAGGVINIITRAGEHPHATGDPIELILRGGYGSFGTNEQSGFLALKRGPFSQQFSFERELSDGFRDDREYRNLALSSESWLRTRLGLTRIFLALGDRPFGADQFYGDFNSWERTKTWVANLSQDLGKRTLLTLGYRRHSDLYELLRDNPGFYTNRHIDDTWDVAIRRNDTLGRLVHVYYGLEGLADHVASNNLGTHSRKQGAIYGGLDLRAIRRGSLNAGVREEAYGPGARTIFVPNISGGYWLSSQWKLRASVSRAFRIPSYTDLYYSDPADLGNPNLKPEQATNYEAGVDFFSGKRWRFTATVFDRDEHNGIDYVRPNSNSIWQAMNFDHINFVGLEAGLSMALPQRQSLEAQYTWLHGAQGGLNGLQSKYVFNYPTQQAVISWQRNSTRGWMARLRAGATNQLQRNTYVLVDASASWMRWRVHPYMRLTNLLNSDYQPVLGVVMPGRAALAGAEICVYCGNH
jgi:iron complex outermembrane receptor protein